MRTTRTADANRTTEETCHCGAAFNGSDHCWPCGCEQWETECNFTHDPETCDTCCDN